MYCCDCLIGYGYTDDGVESMQEVLVSFENKKSGIMLAGSLMLPNAVTLKTPVMILINGYGPTDRNMTFMERKPFLKIAQWAADQGIATLRYDKRGVGESNGTWQDATTYDFIDDAQSAFNFLQHHEEYHFGKIGFCGLSEGGLIACAVASQSPAVDFLVLLAPAFLGADDALIVGAIGMQLKADGASEHFMRADHAMRIKLHQIIRQEHDLKKAELVLTYMLQDYFLQQKSEEKAEAEKLFFAITEKKMVQQIAVFNSPWYRAFLSINPVALLEHVHIPILMLSGSLDFIAPTKYIFDIAKQGLTQNDHVSYIVLPNHNHAFLPVQTGSFAEYPALKEDISDVTLEAISSWVLKQC